MLNKKLFCLAGLLIVLSSIAAANTVSWNDWSESTTTDVEVQANSFKLGESEQMITIENFDDCGLSNWETVRRNNVHAQSSTTAPGSDCAAEVYGGAGSGIEAYQNHDPHVEPGDTIYYYQRHEGDTTSVVHGIGGGRRPGDYHYNPPHEMDGLNGASQTRADVNRYRITTEADADRTTYAEDNLPSNTWLLNKIEWEDNGGNNDEFNFYIFDGTSTDDNLLLSEEGEIFDTNDLRDQLSFMAMHDSNGNTFWDDIRVKREETADSGSLLTNVKSFDEDIGVDSLEASIDVELNGGSGSMEVLSEGDTSDQIDLEDGQNTYSVDGLSQNSDEFQLSFDLEANGNPEVSTASLSGDSANEPPEVDSVVNPVDGEAQVGLGPDLEVDVYDPDGEDMVVTFYQGSPGEEEIGSSSATNTDNAVLEAEDHNLGDESGTTYEWSIEVDDGEETIESDTWSFTTINEPEILDDSAEPDAGIVSTSPELSVNLEHEDDRDMDVAFFIDGEFVDEVVNFEGGAASISVDDRLDAGQSYEWHIEVDDGEFEVGNDDSPWSFDTDSGEPEIETEFGDGVNVNPSQALLEVRPDHSHASELDNVTLLDSNDNVVDYWDQGANAGEVLTLIWNDLDRNQEYEWSAEVEHEGETERTSINSFTTFAVDINLVGEVEGAEGYNIYRREGIEGDAEFDYGNADYEFLGSVSELGNLRDATESLEEGKDYCYVTTAENLAGESIESNEECVEGVAFD